MEVARIVPLPDAARLAPVPTTITAPLLVPPARVENEGVATVQAPFAVVQISEPFAVSNAGVVVVRAMALALNPPLPVALLIFQPTPLESSMEIPPAESMEIFPGLVF